jgi:hypothetical protein
MRGRCAVNPQIQNLSAVFADFVADHTANSGAAHRAQRTAAGQYRAGYGANARACRSALTFGCTAAHAEHCQGERTGGQSINCFHLNLLACIGLMICMPDCYPYRHSWHKAARKSRKPYADERRLRNLGRLVCALPNLLK